MEVIRQSFSFDITGHGGSEVAYSQYVRACLAAESSIKLTVLTSYKAVIC